MFSFVDDCLLGCPRFDLFCIQLSQVEAKCTSHQALQFERGARSRSKDEGKKRFPVCWEVRAFDLTPP